MHRSSSQRARGARAARGALNLKFLDKTGNVYLDVRLRTIVHIRAYCPIRSLISRISGAQVVFVDPFTAGHWKWPKFVFEMTDVF